LDIGFFRYLGVAVRDGMFVGFCGFANAADGDEMRFEAF
jgi:hypothetical protein